MKIWYLWPSIEDSYKYPPPRGKCLSSNSPQRCFCPLWFLKAFAVCLRWSTPISYLASIFPRTEAVYQIISKPTCLQAGPLRNPPLYTSRNAIFIFYVDKQENFGTLQNRMLSRVPVLGKKIKPKYCWDIKTWAVYFWDIWIALIMQSWLGKNIKGLCVLFWADSLSLLKLSAVTFIYF